MLQLLPLCHSLAWLGNSPEQEQDIFGAVCQMEKPNHALPSGGPLLPPALPSRALPNSQRPGLRLCCKSTVTPALPGFTRGNKSRDLAWRAAAHPAGAEEGPAVPWGGYAQLCSRDGERTRPG